MTDPFVEPFVKDCEPSVKTVVLSPSNPSFDHEAIFLEKLDEIFELPAEAITPEEAPTKVVDDKDFFDRNIRLLKILIDWDIVNEKLPPGMIFSEDKLTVQQTLNLLKRSEQRRRKQIFDERVGRSVYPGLERRATRRRTGYIWMPNHSTPTFENGPDSPYSLRDEIKPALVNTDEEDLDDDWSHRFNVNDKLLSEVLDAGEGSVKSLGVLNYIGFMHERYLPSHKDNSLPNVATKANILDVIHGMYEANEMFGDFKESEEDLVNFHDSLTPLFGNLNEIKGFAKKLERTGKIGVDIPMHKPSTPENTKEDLQDYNKLTDSSQVINLSNQDQHLVHVIPLDDDKASNADLIDSGSVMPIVDAAGIDKKVSSSLTNGSTKHQTQSRLSQVKPFSSLTIDTTLAQQQYQRNRPKTQLDPLEEEEFSSLEPAESWIAETLLRDELEATHVQSRCPWMFSRMAGGTAEAEGEVLNPDHWVQGFEMPQWSAAFRQFEREQAQLQFNKLQENLESLNTQNAMLIQTNLTLANQNTQLTTLFDRMRGREAQLETALRAEVAQRQEWEAKCKLWENAAEDLGVFPPKNTSNSKGT